MSQASLLDPTLLEKHRYTPLLGEAAIRLLRILPGDAQEVLHSYDAISYTWGDLDAPKQQVVINSRRFDVTENASLVLKRLREPRRARMVWIDTICIDQDNVLEKNHQVGLMGEFYAHAEQTWVWLGPFSDDSETAMDFVKVLNQTLAQLSELPHVDGAMLYEKTRTHHGSPEWLALGRLFARTWFGRVWVIQEVALSRRVSMVCGPKVALYEDFASLIDKLRFRGHSHMIPTISRDPTQLTSGHSTFAGIDFMRKNHWQMQHSEIPLADVLFNSMGFEASDPRDKIFGVLGLVNPVNRNKLQPDYAKSTEEVYRLAAEYALMEYDSFDMLHLAGVTHTGRNLRLPSWVPDFSKDIASNPFVEGSSQLHQHYAAGGDSRSARAALPRFNSGSLVLQGYLADTACKISGYRVSATQRVVDAGARSWSYWLQEAVSLAGMNRSSFSDVPMIGVLWRTLVANSSYLDKKPAPASYERDFDSLRAIYLSGGEYSALDLQHVITVVSKNPHYPSQVKEEACRYLFAVMDCTIGRRFCITTRGDFGLVPAGTAEGDEILVFRGAQTPFVVRRDLQREQRDPDGVNYLLVGDCYIDNLMHGEALKGFDAEDIVLH